MLLPDPVPEGMRKKRGREREKDGDRGLGRRNPGLFGQASRRRRNDGEKMRRQRDDMRDKLSLRGWGLAACKIVQEGSTSHALVHGRRRLRVNKEASGRLARHRFHLPLLLGLSITRREKGKEKDVIRVLWGNMSLP